MMQPHIDQTAGYHTKWPQGGTVTQSGFPFKLSGMAGESVEKHK